MIGYAVGNSAGPQYWKAEYQPRNRVPWIILAVCWGVSALLLLAAAQVAFGRRHVWVPGFLRRLSVSQDRMARALGKVRPVARLLDRWFHRRLPALTTPAAARVAAAARSGCCPRCSHRRDWLSAGSKRSCY